LILTVVHAQSHSLAFAATACSCYLSFAPIKCSLTAMATQWALALIGAAAVLTTASGSGAPSMSTVYGTVAPCMQASCRCVHSIMQCLQLCMMAPIQMAPAPHTASRTRPRVKAGASVDSFRGHSSTCCASAPYAACSTSRTRHARSACSFTPCSCVVP
jgi:hypothetical protein